MRRIIVSSAEKLEGKIPRAIPRNPDGTFMRIRKPWSLENFNDGYIDNHGRFKVWLPDHPRAYSDGSILRSIVAYEAYYNVIVPRGMDIHHDDEDRLNDTKDNLIMMTHSKHSKLSNRRRFGSRHWITKICQECGKEFNILQGRINQGRGKYCSQECYYTHNKGKNNSRHSRVMTLCKECGKTSEHIPSRKRTFCSPQCSAINSWRKRRRA